MNKLILIKRKLFITTLGFLYAMLIFSCNKSMSDFEDINYYTGKYILKPDIPKQIEIFQDLDNSSNSYLRTFSLDTFKQQVLSFEVADLLYTIEYFNDSIHIVNKFNSERLFLSDSKVILLASNSGYTEFEYDDNGNIIYAGNPLSNIKYHYFNNLLSSTENYVAGSYSITQIYEYSDSLFLNPEILNSKCNPINVIQSYYSAYDFLNIFGKRNNALLKTIVTKSGGITHKVEKYKWDIKDGRINEVDIYVNDRIKRKALFKY